MSHTPGPWHVRGYRTGTNPTNAQPQSIWIDCVAATKSGRSLAGTVAEVYANGTGSDNPSVQDANARLIAAAPDLLAALHAMLDVQGRRRHPLGMPDEGIAGDAADAASKARAAIAKAEAAP